MQTRLVGSAAAVLLLSKLIFCVTDVNHPPGVRTVRVCAAAAVLLIATIEFLRPWLGLKLSILLWPQMLVLREWLATRLSPEWALTPELWGGALAAALAVAVWLREERTSPVGVIVQIGGDTWLRRWRWSLLGLCIAYLLGGCLGELRVMSGPSGWRIQPTDARHLLNLSPHDNGIPLVLLVDALPPVLLSLMLLNSAGRVPRQSLAAWVMVSGMAIAIVWLACLWTGKVFVFDQTPPSGSFSNRNTTAPLIAIAAACGLVLARMPNLSLPLRAVAGIVALGLAISSLAVGSRNGIMVVGSVLMLWLLCGAFERLNLSKARLGVAAAVLAVGIWALLWIPLPKEDSVKTESLQRAVVSVTALRQGDFRTATSDRAGIYAAGARLFADHPLTGAGLGTVPMALHHSGPYKDSITSFDAETYVTHLHSMPLQMLAECGVLGFVAWMTAFLILPVAFVLKKKERGLWAIPLAAMGVANLFDAVWLTPGLPILAMVLLLLPQKTDDEVSAGSVGGGAVPGA